MSEHTTRSWEPKAYRGSRFKNSAKGRCPYCGQPLSHGVRGDPTTRKIPPCQRPKRSGQIAANLPTKYSLEKRQARAKLTKRRAEAQDGGETDA